MSSQNTDNLFNEREKEILSKAWLCMKSPPEFDMDKLAKLTNYTNPRSLYPAMRNIKKKIAEANGDDEQESAAGPSTPANNAKGKGAGSGSGTASSRKRKTVAAAAGESATTPTKRTKRRKSTVKTEATVKDEEMSEEMRDADEKEFAGGAGEDEEMMDGEV
ncbi:hypothetical protein DL766_006436 [Monosporascus sp. MC13-8B]|uniref:Uncharacterized protein n=1 Tax=Monosporascus cannonballus TaxID=155416 RepID=A0ABY0HD75_9PEZI|nr:hypothetical protein DL762_002975 [Monosporascus cannonballus]RYO96626.1 hypothetical protein DL763_003112 [Monosporascus cannonballus]RYP27374.1 hypothetical protein DL766_006436 [Monosporascus sp. MC13-8B]